MKPFCIKQYSLRGGTYEFKSRTNHREWERDCPSVAETLFGILLILGFKIRMASVPSGLLLLSFGDKCYLVVPKPLVTIWRN